MQSSTQSDIRFLRLPDVKVITGLSRSMIYKKISENDFPKQINVGSNSVVWVKKDIDDWCDQVISKATWSFTENLQLSLNPAETYPSTSLAMSFTDLLKESNKSNQNFSTIHSDKEFFKKYGMTKDAYEKFQQMTVWSAEHLVHLLTYFGDFHTELGKDPQEFGYTIELLKEIKESSLKRQTKIKKRDLLTF